MEDKGLEGFFGCRDISVNSSHPDATGKAPVLVSIVSMEPSTKKPAQRTPILGVATQSSGSP